MHYWLHHATTIQKQQQAFGTTKSMDVQHNPKTKVLKTTDQHQFRIHGAASCKSARHVTVLTLPFPFGLTILSRLVRIAC